jgi:hypothetical protein
MGEGKKNCTSLRVALSILGTKSSRTSIKAKGIFKLFFPKKRFAAMIIAKGINSETGTIKNELASANITSFMSENSENILCISDGSIE